MPAVRRCKEVTQATRGWKEGRQGAVPFHEGGGGKYPLGLEGKLPRGVSEPNPDGAVQGDAGRRGTDPG
jgi:hypothetical protein